MPLSQLQRDVLSNRARLILREDRAVAGAAALVRKMIAGWAREFRRAARGGPALSSASETVRRGAILRRMDAITQRELDAVARRVRASVAPVYKGEYLRIRAIVDQQASLRAGRVSAGFAAVNTRAVAAALESKIPGLALTNYFSNLSATTQRRMRRDLADAIARGESIETLARKWAAGKGAGRALREAATLARTSMMAASSAATAQSYRDAREVVRGVQWEATFDSRTCIVAGTTVLTRRGLLPIEQVAIGDFVWTGNGRWRTVTAIPSRQYRGDLVSISGTGFACSMTGDHLVWRVGSGWMPASMLEVGDEVLQIGQVFPRNDVAFFETKNPVPHSRKSGITATVASPGTKSGRRANTPSSKQRSACRARPDSWGFGHGAIVPAEIRSLEARKFSGRVYCLVVQDDASFFAGGVLVHNCMQCASLHGRVFVFGQEPPQPAHFGCRCTLLPVFVEDKITRSLSKPRVPRGLLGPRAQDRKFETWLKKQSAGTKRDFFPSEIKYRAWADGKLSLGDMLRPDGSPLPDRAVVAAIRDRRWRPSLWRGTKADPGLSARPGPTAGVRAPVPAAAIAPSPLPARKTERKPPPAGGPP